MPPAAKHARSASDLNRSTIEATEPKMASGEILRREVREALTALSRPTAALFISGLSAGLDVGFSLLLMATMLTQTRGQLPSSVVHILVANMYSVGFIFVVLGRSELFTEQTTLAVLPVLQKKAKIGALLRLWVLVYVANVIGATAFARLATWVGPALGIIEPSAFGEIAHRLTDHTSTIIFASGLLAGWLMGLLSWLVAAGRDTISQLVIVWLITAAIGFTNVHHAVLGTVEVLAGFFAHQGITLAEFERVLLWTTLGNIFGGSIFVSLIKYTHARPEGQTV